MSSGELTTTSYAVLNLLSVQPWTTYELAKQMRRNYHWFWPRAESKLYEEPKKLVALGLATARTELVGKRPRRTYVITPAGRKALADWLRTPGSPSPVLEFEAVVRVFAATNGSVDDLRSTLQAVVEEMDRWQVFGRAIGSELAETGGPFPERLHVNTLVHCFIWEYCEAVRRWATWAMEETRCWEDITIENKKERAIAILNSTPFSSGVTR